MITVAIIGSGNLATHLIKAFLSSNDVKLIQVVNRTKSNISYLAGDIKITDDIEQLQPADVTIIAISDDAIKDFSKRLNTTSLVVHTSGTISLKALKGDYRKGVFYPLQTMSKDRKVSFKKIPICLETSDEKDLSLLTKLASSISNHTYYLDSDQRKKLHLAAVFANNFVNHMYTQAHEICESNNIPFEILQPLIRETAKKIKTLSPEEAQTGPAARNNSVTIKKQKAQLADDQLAIYTTITNSILKSSQKNHE